MATKQFTGKDSAEIVPLTFDFSAVLSTITSVSSVSVRIKSGIDVNVASMLEGAAQIQGTKVVQLVKAGVNGASYVVRAEVFSGAEKYVLSALLPVNEG